MDLYHVWFDLKPGVRDTDVCEAIDAYLGALQASGTIACHRISRRKLGLGPGELGEFHVQIEVESLAQLDRAFDQVAARSGPLEGLHAAVNQQVHHLTFALYRDFPDPGRVRGQEAF